MWRGCPKPIRDELLIENQFAKNAPRQTNVVELPKKQNNLFGHVGKLHKAHAFNSSLLDQDDFPVTVFTSQSALGNLLSFVKGKGMVFHVPFTSSINQNVAMAKLEESTVLISNSTDQFFANAHLSYLLSTKGNVIHYYYLTKEEKAINFRDFDLSIIAKYISSNDSTSPEDFAKKSGINSEKFVAIGPKDATTVIVGYGGAHLAAEESILKASSTLFVQIVQFNPFDAAQFIKLLPHSVKDMHLVEPTGLLYSEIVQSLHSEVALKNVVIEELDTKSRLYSHFQGVNTVEVLEKEQNLHSDILSSVFKDHLQVFNSKGSPEVAFGSLVSDLQKYETFVQSVTELSDSNLSAGFKSNLQSWLKSNGKSSDTLSKQLIEEASNLDQSEFVRHHQEYFKRKSRWIVDVETLLDLSNTTIHTILSSGENLNLLIIDQCSYDTDLPAPKNRRDAGLYALNYNIAYVAAICPLYSYTQAVQAVKEADAFNGPSVIILHAPKGNTGNKTKGSLQSIKLAKKAIDNGLITLYRWTPKTNDTEESLLVDSSKTKATLQKYLDKEANLSLLLEEAKISKDTGLESQIESKVQQKALDSYKKLFGGMNKKKLLILFGSDGGNAESLAKRIGMEAKEKGLFVKTLPMDAFVTEDLANEEHVLFVISTAGQGEFPGNARETWKFLSANDLDLSKVNFSVFALGDRQYWPRPEDSHYFAKAGKDLDIRLAKLNGKRLTPIGVGDDRDPDGYFTGFNQWVPEFWTALGVEAESLATQAAVPSDDAIKAASNYLRGTIAEGLLDTSTGALSEFDTKLTKFHGIYQQDDRDIRELRARKGLEKAFSFMIRVRVPGGIATPAQYIAMDDISDKWANGTIKLTTRQAFQFHGIVKSVLKRSMQDINKSLLDSIAACGDVNRNVMCNPDIENTEIHKIVFDFAKRFSEHLLPATAAYHEIWLDKKLVAGGEEEPLYGKTYLPRKFKTAIAVPPSNDVDVLAHDLGYIAIIEDGKFIGFNVTVGGGMGTTHGNKKTYPLLAQPLGFCTLEQAVAVGEKVMLVQRDYGDRTNRKHARLKYTIEDRGIEWFRNEVESRLGFKLEKSKPYKFTSNGDRYGWKKNSDGTWSYTLFIQNGRIKDTPDYKLKTGLREIAAVHQGVFALSPNQHLVISKIPENQKATISNLLAKYGIDNNGLSGLRLNSMACVALPTCGLAMAESERYLPSLVGKIENILEENGLREESITIRMTGCPNGCARPSIAEIAFVGKAPGMYNMYLGGGFAGERLNKLYKESVGEEDILSTLAPIIKDYSRLRRDGEHFGDFVIRQGIVSA
ncbi:hypothetical protein HK103_005404 [Boothiomyces macroporosus]|uniref:assimilatory sulfite reductase (NADPH) n=1 Tax=Boothiomyces macroporosus TaxID=261099 RepID=A0AAD5YAW9_9FUNG|nr:hypothetical protein HK103_005404 [Boothiomyces macroporosus]